MCYFISARRSAALLLLGLAALLAGCGAKPKPHFVTDYPLRLESAVNSLSRHLLQQVRKEREESKQKEDTSIVLDPFVDANSGEVVRVSRTIERMILAEGKNNFEKFKMWRITPSLLREADYVMNGTIYSQEYRAGGKQEQYYRLSASVVDLSNGRIIANSNAWISDLNLDYTPVAFYQDSPTYLKDEQVEGLIETAKSQTGSTAQKDYYDTLPTEALLVEAGTLYEEQEYRQAREMFEEAAERDDGQSLRTYAGLYGSYYKMGDLKQAEQAFAKLLKVSAEKHGNFNVKFLFEVNSTEFIGNTGLRKQYKLWLGQIADYFRKNDQCFHVVGHSSRTGSAAYNEQLSLARARQLRYLLRNEYPAILSRSRALGKGFNENIVGLGTDDARDAIDRRVELVLVDCSEV